VSSFASSKSTLRHERRACFRCDTGGERGFDRGRDGITPTEAAEDLMPVAEQIEAMMMRFASAAIS
jgi:hypothetical protein